MKNLVLKPFVEAITGGWQAKASLYGFSDNTELQSATEAFLAFDDKQEAWNNAKEYSEAFAKRHNKNCTCGRKMVVGSY